MVAGVIVEVFSPAGCERALEDHLRRLEAGAREELTLRFRCDLLDAVLDPALDRRLRSAPSATIAAAYRGLLGKVGASAAKVAWARVLRALNGARFSALEAGGAVRPRFDAPGCADLESGLPDARLVLDKLANYQIDLDATVRELESR